MHSSKAGGIRSSRVLAFCAAALAVAVLVVPSVAAGADAPAPFWKECLRGTAGGQCENPRGIGTAPATAPRPGSVYVADQDHKRIEEFTAWGEFIKLWGWDVVESGPDDDTSPPEDQFEICLPANGDFCKSGLQGAGVGQIGFAGGGIAVDSAGGIYYADISEPGTGTARVQKFDSEGHFVWMVGGNVNKTKSEEVGSTEAQRNLCTAASGDVCQAGTQGTGAGQFGEWALGSFVTADTKNTATCADDVIYVGDVGRVQKFDCEGAFKGQIEGSFTEEGTVQSLALDASGKNLYAAFAKEGNFTETKPTVLRVRATGPPAAFVGVATCAMELGEPKALAVDTEDNLYIVDEQGTPRVRQFSASSCTESGSSFAEGELEESTGIATGSACHSQGADLYLANSTILNPFVRAYGPAPDKLEIPSCQPAANPPQILAQYAQGVDTKGATLRAIINPHRWADTTYQVQYGTEQCVEAGGWEAACIKEQPAAPTLLGAGPLNEGMRTAAIVLEGLSPGTAYRYRFVAQSSGDPSQVAGLGGKPGEEGSDAAFTTYAPPTLDSNCPNQAFRIGQSAALPDCRADEMVSPVDKGGGDIIAGSSGASGRDGAWRQSSLDGNRLTYTSMTAFGDAQRGSTASQYLSSRGEEGWSTHGIYPARDRRIDDPGDSNKFGYFVLALDFSDDLCEMLMVNDNRVPLTSDALVGYGNVYVRNNCGSGADSYEALTKDKELLSSPTHKNLSLLYGSLSRDGSHAVFGAVGALTSGAASGENQQIYDYFGGALHLVSVLPPGEGGAAATADAAVGSLTSSFTFQGNESPLSRAISSDGKRIFWTSGGKLYVRIEAKETLLVASGAEFVTASSDGSKVIYKAGNNLFEFDVDGETTSQIAGEAGGVVGSSEDLSYLYFTSKEVLAAGAVAGGYNLYLRQGGNVSLVATVSDKDGTAKLSSHIDSRSPFLNSSRVSGDGRYLAFMSISTVLAEDVAGYDNADVNTGEAISEIYRYDAPSGQLSCVSCNPSGTRPAGRGLEPIYGANGGDPELHAAAWLPTWEWGNHGKRALSEDGSRVFFNAYDSLALGDVNGAQDVYEWEALGAGRCDAADPEYSPLNDGCISLISTGESPDKSEFLDASLNGRDVFFTTASSIDPRDPGSIDVYDAREEGGFPPPPSPPPPCVGDACQSIPAAPTDPTPASATYKGPGDPVPCRKGKVRRKGRCVAKHKHKRQHKRHHRGAKHERGVAR